MMQTVKGHGLIEAGAAHGKVGCRQTACLAYGPRRLTNGGQMHGGHAVCACGERSEHLLSNRERRDWHRKHKMTLDWDEPEADVAGLFGEIGKTGQMP